MEEDLPITREIAAALAESHSRSAAYSAYGQSLLERVMGYDGGLHVLALWRMIAWSSQGSPIKGFTLKASDIYQAEQEILAAIKRQ